MQSKAEIRSLMLQRRKQLSEEEYRLRCQRITHCVTHHPAFQTARWIHTYCSYNREVDTWEIIRSAFAHSKRVMVPVVRKGRLYHVEISPQQQFVPDRFGIPVPQFSTPPQWRNPAVELSTADLILVPLLAFDTALYRIGYGKGYYDRFLATVTATKMGLAFEFQKWNSFLPRESHDVPLDIVVTDEAMYTQRGKHPCIDANS